MCVPSITKILLAHTVLVWKGNRRLEDMHWHVLVDCKKADNRAQEDFDAEWDHLVEFVRENSSVSTSQEGALKWLAELGQRADKFVTRFT